MSESEDWMSTGRLLVTSSKIQPRKSESSIGERFTRPQYDDDVFFGSYGSAAAWGISGIGLLWASDPITWITGAVSLIWVYGHFEFLAEFFIQSVLE